ncbi:hypothetical protein Salat_1744700 [Sesamum alatum]|uniref:Uncharacterized protein n=1 Tax=Sesamum alatum TaxID=300844 RepID=A0AAE2CKH5_9LAMI|nr:hypothetical protein Salat_1744700 [Sesamum alatum]
MDDEDLGLIGPTHFEYDSDNIFAAGKLKNRLLYELVQVEKGGGLEDFAANGRWVDIGGFAHKECVEENEDWINKCASFRVGSEAAAAAEEEDEDKRHLMEVKSDVARVTMFFLNLFWRWWWQLWEEKM